MYEFNSEHFATPEHAIETGWLLGFFISAGITAQPVKDDEGNYLPAITINVPTDEYGSFRSVEVLVVP